MTKKIKKTIIETTFSKERFFPLSEAVSPEFFNLADQSILQRLADEAVSLGSKELVFLGSKDSSFESFFNNLEAQEDILKKKGNPRANQIKELKEKFADLKISFCDDFSQITDFEDDFAYIASNELVSYKETGLEQIMSVFKTSERPVIGLKEAEIGSIETEKIARGLYKVKGFTDQSSFSMIGRAIFTKESKKFFEEAETIKEAIENMMERGHTVYGTLIKGDYFKLDSDLDYIKANLNFTLNSEDKKELLNYLKEEGIV